MAIKPGIGRKSKNPPIFSHEFVIQNHADIVSCVAMVFVVGLMLQATTSIASLFISLHHNVTGADPSHENPRGEPYLYESGYKDYCAIFFYTLICIIMHAVLQEYVLDKISKKLHLSKYKLGIFNESGQLVVFYAMSFLWGIQVIVREGYAPHFSDLYKGFPNHPMTFLHKLFFIIQLAYYLHMLPELYFQRIKMEDQQPKIIHAIIGFSTVALGYFLGYQRIAIYLLTIHYLGDFVYCIVQLIEIFDKDEKYMKMRIMNFIVFGLTRVGTVSSAILGFYFGLVVSEDQGATGHIPLMSVVTLEICLFWHTFSGMVREAVGKGGEPKQAAQPAKKAKVVKTDKSKAKKKESDLPEADQSQRTAQAKKVKTK